MADIDEPVFESEGPRDPDRDGEAPLGERVRRLMEGQDYAVLCTQGGGQPYGSLVAFAVTGDLRHAVFATPTTTRKYRLLSECRQVALVCDDRSTSLRDLMRIEAVTATGLATEIAHDGPTRQWHELLVSRHPTSSRLSPPPPVPSFGSISPGIFTWCAFSR